MKRTHNDTPRKLHLSVFAFPNTNSIFVHCIGFVQSGADIVPQLFLLCISEIPPNIGQSRHNIDMAYRRQLSHHSSRLHKHTITTSNCSRILPACRTIETALSPTCLSYAQTRDNHHLRNSPNLAQVLNTFKRTKHYSAIASEQAARKDSLLKLKHRSTDMGRSTLHQS